MQRQIYGQRDDWFTQINVGLSSRRTEDYDGQLTDERFDLYGNVSGPLQSFAEISVERNKDFYQGVLYDGLDRIEGSASFQPSSELRLVYNFNVRSFVRGIFQYLEVSRDPSLYSFPVEDQTEELFTQLLFSYKLNPQTVLFVGYSDNRLGAAYDLDETDRTFFAKVGYALIL